MSYYGPGGYPPPPPPGPIGQPQWGAPPPQDYLVWAILTTIFCCLPLGIVSIVFSTQVNSKWRMGDYAGAQESSTKARQFAIWAAIGVLIPIVLYFVWVFMVFGSLLTVGGLTW